MLVESSVFLFPLGIVWLIEKLSRDNYARDVILGLIIYCIYLFLTNVWFIALKMGYTVYSENMYLV